jgi:hypothetical protein
VFLIVDDVTALQAAVDRLNPEIIHERLDYRTLILAGFASDRRGV